LRLKNQGRLGGAPLLAAHKPLWKNMGRYRRLERQVLAGSTKIKNYDVEGKKPCH
jgi:hypothetical protein